MEFQDLKVSTRTIIASANVEFDIETIFTKIPMAERKRTRIDRMYYKNKIREGGQKEYEDRNKQKSFRNALNVIMMIDDEKKVNFKVSKNGKFQMTGCKNVEHARIATVSFLEALEEHCPESFHQRSDMFRVFFEIVMTNVDCRTGYCINRQALDRIINTTTPFHSLLETSFGYTGVNIKFPVMSDWKDMEVPVVEWRTGEPLRLSYQPLSSLTVKEGGKVKYNTFLVFHSGQFIMSGMHEKTMKPDYDLFMSILKDHQDQIREVLD